MAKEKGILTIVDGAHVPGHIDFNIHELGCDFFTGAIHKWLCGPKGSSFLYVKKSHQNWVKPIIYSWGKNGDDPGPSEFLQDFQWQGSNQFLVQMLFHQDLIGLGKWYLTLFQKILHLI